MLEKDKKIDASYVWHSGDYIECLGEIVYGDVPVTAYWINGTYHEKGNGIFIGQTSGNIYTVDEVCNLVSVWHKAGTFQYVWPWKIRYEGKVVFILHQSYKIVFNANGDITVDRYMEKIQCPGN